MTRKTIFFAALFLFVAHPFHSSAKDLHAVLSGKGSVKIVNDTKQDVEVHTGTGVVKLNHKGGSTSVSCEEGKEICFSNKGKKGNLIFKIDGSMCGKTVKLSQYLK